MMSYFFIYVSGFLMIFHFNEWFTMWVGLELIMYGFLVICFECFNVGVEESCYKYFFVQSLGSGMLLGLFYLGGSEVLLELVLFYKLGAGPFYFWYLATMRTLNWMGVFFLMGLQKLAPLVLLRELSMTLGWIMVLMSLIIGILGSFNQMSVKELLSFSSLHYLGWVFMMMMYESDLWLLYFFIYMAMMGGVLRVFVVMNVYSIGELEVINKTDFIISLLVMGGIPPMMGFMMKWLAILVLYNMDVYVLMVLIFMSVLMCYVYIRIGLNIMLSNGFWYKGAVYMKSSHNIYNIMGGLFMLIFMGAVM